MSKANALYVYLTEEQLRWLDEMKEQLDMTKSDIVFVILSYARQNWQPEKIKELYENFLILGEAGIK